MTDVDWFMSGSDEGLSPKCGDRSFRTLVFVPGGGGVGQRGEHAKARVLLYSLVRVVTYVALHDDNTGR